MRSLVQRTALALLFGIVLVSPSTVTAQEATPPAASASASAARPACATTSRAAGTPTSMPASSPTPERATTLADWQTIALTDARTGDAYTLGDFVGCTVFVETMATWCSNCRAQLEYVATAAKELDPDQFVFIAISVETEISNDDLARYADDAAFDWLFSVATPDALKAIVDEFGRESIVPGSTPHVIVRPDGTYDDLHTGYSKPDEIVTLMTDASGT